MLAGRCKYHVKKCGELDRQESIVAFFTEAGGRGQAGDLDGKFRGCPEIRGSELSFGRDV